MIYAVKSILISFTIAVLALLPAISYSQVKQSVEYAESQRAELRDSDSLWMIQLPELSVPEHFKSKELPPIVDNSKHPFLRPVFDQSPFWNCGQASSIGYTFTYEINRKRGLPSDTSSNYYPPDFTFNFMNYYHGGVNFNHTFEILKACGTPTEYQYGGFQVDDVQWMSGYDKYLMAMSNRLDQAYSIHVGTEEGINSLKHWLYHHMEDSEVGGVALFSGSSPWNVSVLPEGTHEGGKFVITRWGNAGHNMTIVGYNDSIRFDYNQDGKYTNNIDLNDDGIIDVKDWEIGGLKVVNSYGEFSHNEGFLYITYKSLADPYSPDGAGGIWNNTVVVIDVKETFQPKLTMRVKMRHGSREVVKIEAGISSDTTFQMPIHTIDFPVFNFQGDNFPMQGYTDTIEFGLDITPLLAYFGEGANHNIFLRIIEKDKQAIYKGEVLELEFFDYRNPETRSWQMESKVPIASNAITDIAVPIQMSFVKPKIVPEKFGAYIPGEQFNSQLDVEHGEPPYTWSLKRKYFEQTIDFPFPYDQGEQIPTSEFENRDAGSVALALPFDFPFYGEYYDTVWIYLDGFVRFEKSDHPWPYFIDKDLQARKTSMIAPCFTDLYLTPEDGVFKEVHEDYVMIRWSPRAYHLSQVFDSEFNFAVKLWKSGQIEFLYGSIYSQLAESWASIVSKGDDCSYHFTSVSNNYNLQSDISVQLQPQLIPDDMEISDDGKLSFFTLERDIFDIEVQAVDNNRIVAIKKYQLSDGLELDIHTRQIDQNESKKEILIGLELTNTSDIEINDLIFQLELQNSNAEYMDVTEQIGSIWAGESISIEDAFLFSYHPVYDAGSSFTGHITFSSEEGVVRKKDFFYQDITKDIETKINWIDDGENGKLESGETAELVFEVCNHSSQAAENVKIQFSSHDPYLAILDPLQLTLGDLNPYSKKEFRINIKVNNSTPKGYVTHLNSTVESTYYSNETHHELWMNSHEREIVIFYFDGNNLELAYRYEQQLKETNSFLPEVKMELSQELSPYSLVILTLGAFGDEYQLNAEESAVLVDYLNQGGNLLLQGGNAFYDNIGLAIFDYFRVEPEYWGWVESLDTLRGMENTFTQEMLFEYWGASSKIDNLKPLEDAYLLIEEPASGLGFAVANEEENYKTIGSSVDLTAVSGLNSVSSGGKLMQGIVDFFGMKYLVAANFSANRNHICQNESILFTNHSSSSVTELFWEFPGGYPSESSETNPEVVYAEAGSYPVKLIAYGEGQTDTLVKEFYILIENCSSVQEHASDFNIYPNPATSQINILSNSFLSGKIEITLWNSNGQLVFSRSIDSRKELLIESIPIEDLPKGIYVLKINEEKHNYSTKVLVQ